MNGQFTTTTAINGWMRGRAAYGEEDPEPSGSRNRVFNVEGSAAFPCNSRDVAKNFGVALKMVLLLLRDKPSEVSVERLSSLLLSASANMELRMASRPVTTPCSGAPFLNNDSRSRIVEQSKKIVDS